MATTTLQTDAPLVRVALSPGSESVDQVARYSLDLNPPYQRGSVWGPRRQRLLVKSLLQGRPVGNVYLNDRGDIGSEFDFVVVDGKQRIETVRAFLDSSLLVPASWFPAPEVLATKDIGDGPYAAFGSLTCTGQGRFLRTSITVNMTQYTDVDAERELFDLVNFGGLAQGQCD